MTARTDNDFLDTGGARIIAAVIALVLIAIIFLIWYDDLDQFAFWNDAPETAIETDLKAANSLSPAQQSCFDRRSADVDAMRNQGVIDERQYQLFLTRAEDLCRAQN